MWTMRNTLWFLAAVSALYSGLRTLQDGPQGELITVLILIGSSVLLGAGAIVDRLDHLRESRPPKD